MKKTTIILANSPINDGNRGCVALTISSVFLIDMILKQKCVDYNLYILDSYINKRGKQVMKISGNDIYYTPISYPYGISFKENVKAILHIGETLKSLLLFRKADYIIDLGKGDSFADIYGKKRFSTIDRIHKLARFFSKPYLLLPQTIGPFDNFEIASKAHLSISNAKMVMARDKESLYYVKNNVPEQKEVEEYIDVAFFLPYNKKYFDQRHVHVGLNVSSLLWRGGYTGDNQFGLKDDYQRVVRAVIELFLKQENVILHLVPHVVGKNGKTAADTAVSKSLIDEYNSPQIILAPYFETPIEAKDYISGLDFFMGARMHSTIAAFSSGVPVVPMAYSRKFNGLFLDTLEYPFMVDLKSEMKDMIVNRIFDAFQNREKLKMIIQNKQAIISEKKNLIIANLSHFFNV